MRGFLRKLKTAALACIFLAATAILAEEIEILELDVVSYEDFIRSDKLTLQTLERALHEKGIVGIRGIPGYKEKAARFIQAARDFAALEEDVKNQYAPRLDLGETFLGYEVGKEKFKRVDGRWVVDDLKASYYGFVPDTPSNKWPSEVDIQTSFQEVGDLMAEMGRAVMASIGLIGEKGMISLEGGHCLGRMLYYRKNGDTSKDDPMWCGAHFDHSVFTALLPAYYFKDGQASEEPLEAGLFVKTHIDGCFKKVLANDPDVMLFQVGEFGQLASNDAIRATEHYVHKASDSIERFTMALFFDAPMNTVIHSTSVLTSDKRYGGDAGDPCSYKEWDERSFYRFVVKEHEQKENNSK